VDEFILCTQATDVFELGLALVDLYNGREHCLSKPEIASLVKGTYDLTPLLSEIKSQQIKDLIVAMLNPDPDTRIRMSDIDITQLFPNTLALRKMLSLSRFFNESADNNMVVINSVLDAFLNKEARKIECYTCATKTVN